MNNAEARLFEAMESCSNFTNFKDLPPELRIKIWQHAITGPRTVIVESPFTRPPKPMPRSLEDALSRACTEDTVNEDTWWSRTAIPSLLHVNTEARHEALKHYQLSLGAGTAQPKVYVDFSRDTLFFGHAELKPECSGLWASTKDLQRVRRLAVVPEGSWRVMHWQKVGLGALERIIFTHETDDLCIGSRHQLAEDAPSVCTEVAPNICMQDRDLLEPQAEGDRRQLGGGESTQESAMAVSCAQDPVKKRMQAAREEMDILLEVVPTQWIKTPVVSTAVFRERPGTG